MEREFIKYIYQEEIYDLSAGKAASSKKKINTESQAAPEKIVVLVDDSFEKYKELFTKILSAVNLSSSDVNLIPGKTSAAPAALDIESGKIISLGIQLPEEFPVNKVIRHNNALVLMSHSLEELNNDSTNLKKRNLWNALKEMFS